MLSEQKAATYLENKIVEVKERIASILGNISVEDVKQADSRELFRQKIIKEIRKKFPINPEWSDPNPIRKVLFE